MTIPEVQLSNGVKMPILGLGVFRIQNGGAAVSAVKHALKAGYRSIDTASLYGNEEGVGQAIRLSGLEREQLFVTTKVWNTEQGYESTLQAFEQSRTRLGLQYIDLYLVHWPISPTFIETWKAIEELYRQKKIRAIGVSNFYQHHLDMLLENCTIPPMVNQVELHPMLQLPELRSYCAQKNILVEAWAPIMRGQVNRITLLKRIGDKYNKTPVQVSLRWAIQHNIIVIPKSVNPLRIEAHADVFDFSLTDEEMKRIDAINRNRRIGPHPDDFNS